MDSKTVREDLKQFKSSVVSGGPQGRREGPKKKTLTRPLTLIGVGASEITVGKQKRVAPLKLRFLLLEKLADGRRDYSAAALDRAVPAGAAPHRTWPARDGVVGEFFVTVRPTKTGVPQHDLVALHAAARGKELRVEVKTRHFAILDASGATVHGTALDLVDMALVAPPAAAAAKK